MMSVEICVFLLAAGVWNGVSTSPADRIIGGTLATIGEYPYQVSLRYDEFGGHLCGGSIIGIIWILTAAHCVETEDALVLKPEVVVGTNKLYWGGQSYWVRKVIPHEFFNPDLMDNDIALLQLKENIEISDTVKIIPFLTSVPPDGSTCQLSGFGLLSEQSNDMSRYMQQVNLTIMPLKDCKNFYLDTDVSVSTKNLCTSKHKERGACGGDNGGPLVFDGRQVGILSWYDDICDLEKPIIYTSVPEFSSWITNKTGISAAITTMRRQPFFVSLIIAFCISIYY